MFGDHRGGREASLRGNHPIADRHSDVRWLVEKSCNVGRPAGPCSMHVVDRLYAIGAVRKALWRMSYGFITRRVDQDELLFLNYAFEDAPPQGLVLDSEDEPNRACIQLYHLVADQAELRGKTVLEVSCGHGGGASYLTRTFSPHKYTGLDLNGDGVRFCRRRHRLNGLDFVEGDAEALPFEDGSVDAVINIEASHCYASFPRFLDEVARVLRTGGHFHYADFRFPDGLQAWEAALASAPLQKRQQRDIGSGVLRGMTRNSARSRALIARHLPKPFHKLAADFAGIEGSRVYRALQAGELAYRSYCFQK